MVCGVRGGYVDGQVLREILDIIIEHCVRYSLFVLYTVQFLLFTLRNT